MKTLRVLLLLPLFAIALSAIAQTTIVDIIPASQSKEHAQNSEPNIAVEINYREAIIPLVLAGAGTSLLPVRMAADAQARGAVVQQLRPRLSRQIGLLHRPTRLSPAAAAMVRLAMAGNSAAPGTTS